MKKLIVNEISKSFADKSVLRNISFSVEEGKLFSLLGGNGAGKSTMIKMLLGFIKPDHGTMYFDEYDLAAQDKSVRKEIFYLPEQVSLYPELSAIENIKYLSSLSQLKTNEQSIHSSLEELGLNTQDHRIALKKYSKGMRQKVALAFTKLKNPSLLLLDEPTSGLDPSANKDFIDLIQSLKSNGSCVVMVTHDLRCAHTLADEIGILDDGILRKKFSTDTVSLRELEDSYYNI